MLALTSDLIETGASFALHGCMSKPFEQWTVLPHGAITAIGDDILTVTGKIDMPLGETERRMTVVRLADGRLVIYSAIALDEAQMSRIEAFGVPSFLIVPSDIHRLDAKIWKDRYPRLRVIAPIGARDKVDELVPVDATEIDFGDPTVQFMPVPGTDDRESALLIVRDGKTTLVVADLVFNAPNQPGFSGWLFKTLGITADHPHLPTVVKMARVKDEEALRKQLEVWAHLPNLERIIVAHGNIIANDAAHVLEEIASHLAA
jgi:hypothetical protein